MQTALPGRMVTSPIDGVVVRARVRDSGGALRLRVIRPSPGGYMGAGSSAPAVAGPGISTFNTRLPINKGDYIGVDIPADGALGARMNGGAEFALWTPPLGDGESRGPNFSLGGLEGLGNADIEPDADRDGFGDETQDLCSKDPTTQGLCRGPCANAKNGTPGNDTIAGTVAGDLVNALAGNDVVNGDSGDDCIDGGLGNDRLSGGSGHDKLSGGAGRDKLSGGPGNDKLFGGSGADTIVGGKGKNSYSGGAGNDVVNSVNGKRESVNCGSGSKDRVRADMSDRLRGCEIRQLVR